jgi:hypothetical protein
VVDAGADVVVVVDAGARVVVVVDAGAGVVVVVDAGAGVDAGVELEPPVAAPLLLAPAVVTGAGVGWRSAGSAVLVSGAVIGGMLAGAEWIGTGSGGALLLDEVTLPIPRAAANSATRRASSMTIRAGEGWVNDILCVAFWSRLTARRR